MKKTLLLFVTSLICVESKYDCNAGCSLDASVMGPPVCGEDGLTYANECIAFCQGIQRYSPGACGDEGNRIEDPDLSGDTEVITLEVMNRFEQESFRFVAKVTEFSSEPIREENMHTSNIFVARETPSVWHAVRITSEGYKFISKEKPTLTMQGPTESFRGSVEENGSNLRQRKMAIIGEDTRSVVADTTIFPFRAMGALDFSWGDNGCSATMISRTSALTAGHCIYDFPGQKQRPMTRIAPGRFHDVNQREPFGTWEVDYMTTFQGFMDTNNEIFDIGVVTFKPRRRFLRSRYPGDVVGFLAIDRVMGTSTSVNDDRLLTMTLAGYPFDFKEGQMVTTGLCSSPPQSVGPNYIYHTCDTVGGMSGSSVKTANNIVLGVHNGVHRPSSGLTNGASVLSSEYFEIISRWAGLTNQPQSCKCSQFGNKRILRLFCNVRNLGACIGRS